ncbi:hypothetical protein E4U57_002836 [Claviceps arundinis]|uniref:Vps72/YL1 C-terminal domain-containing protein n=1 Tax=Claviceps arundinis TaxID=1623583 RepID=A0ABQ7P9U2_9HYPO|nr:hypothetical protein E4U57_002836 [Claviceps arundinis]
MSDQDTSQLSEPLSDLDSLSDSDAPVPQTGWLATTRERRSTAGNRMKSVLANEDPDSDLELLFAEDENDRGFSDVGSDGSDVQMDSSSDDEDDNNANPDDLEGEKELERQAKAKSTAQRKRKAQEAIPAKFRKKVRIDPTATASTTSAPPPRPKKKSERTSWLPSATDLPTRASSRKTTRISKEQLHLQMAEREARRLKQLAQMEKKAARLEAMKKPPMTQEERLAEAAIVEERNSKSLNRWEEAEKQREQERKAKLAALNQRTLRGPFITFWSGKGQWDDLELRSLRPYVTEVEEKPKKKKKEKPDKGGAGMRGKKKNKDSISAMEGQEDGSVTGGEAKQTDDMKDKSTTNSGEEQLGMTTGGKADESKDGSKQPSRKGKDTDTGTHAVAQRPIEGMGSHLSPVDRASINIEMSLPGSPTSSSTDTPSATPVPSQPAGALSKATTTTTTAAATTKDVEVPPPLPSSSVHTALAAPSIPRPHESRPPGVLAAPVLAPPPGMDMNGSRMTEAPKSNILAPPTISLSEPSQVSLSEPKSHASSETYLHAARAEESGARPPQPRSLLSATTPSSDSRDVSADPDAPASAQPETEADAEPEPPRDMNATRNGIIYQNFSEAAMRDRNIQTLVLFGRKMSRLPRPAAPPVCVITNNPARYQDPKTGLPFYNMYAYKELQRLYHGDYNWSRLVGAWVGSGSCAAKGVPERFLNPKAESERQLKPATTASATPSAPVSASAKDPVQQATDGEVVKREELPKSIEGESGAAGAGEQLSGTINIKANANVSASSSSSSSSSQDLSNVKKAVKQDGPLVVVIE